MDLLTLAEVGRWKRGFPDKSYVVTFTGTLKVKMNRNFWFQECYHMFRNILVE